MSRAFAVLQGSVLWVAPGGDSPRPAPLGIGPGPACWRFARWRPLGLDCQVPSWTAVFQPLLEASR